MKKTMFWIIPLLLLSFLSAEAQSKKLEDVEKFFAQEIITEIGGVVIAQSDVDKHNTVLVTVTVPKYYDFSLIQSSTSRVIRRYSDVKVFQPWTFDRGIYSLNIVIDNKYPLAVGWGVESRLLFFIWNQELEQ